MKVVWENFDVRPGLTVIPEGQTSHTAVIIEDANNKEWSVDSKRFALLNPGTGKIYTPLMSKEEMAAFLNKGTFEPDVDGYKKLCKFNVK